MQQAAFSIVQQSQDHMGTALEQMGDLIGVHVLVACVGKVGRLVGGWLVGGLVDERVVGRGLDVDGWWMGWCMGRWIGGWLVAG